MAAEVFDAEIQALQSLFERKLYQDFVARAEEVAARFPGFAPLHGHLGVALLKLKREAEAEAQLRKAVELDPGYADAVQNLAIALTVQRKGREAVKWLERLSQLEPARPTIPLMLCNVLSVSDIYDAGLVERALRGTYADFFAKHTDVELRTARSVSSRDLKGAMQPLVHILDTAQEVVLTDAVSGARYEFPVKETAAVTVPGGRCIGNWDYVLTAAGEVLKDSGCEPIEVPYVTMPHLLLDNLGLVAFPAKPGVVEVDADALFFSGASLHHVGIFYFDVLPRLRAWKVGCPAMKIAIAADTPRYHREMLAGFGVAASDLIECDRAREYRFRSLTFYRIAEPQIRNPHAVRFTHAGIAPAIAPSGPQEGKRLYLQRSGTARGRNIANAREFEALLARHGFQTVRRPEYSFAEQNALFGEAAVAVSAFGTDSITIFQLRPKTDVILFTFADSKEIGAAHYIEELAYACAAIGMRFHVLPCQPAGEANGKPYFRDLVVDCAALERLLKSILRC